MASPASFADLVGLTTSLLENPDEFNLGEEIAGTTASTAVSDVVIPALTGGEVSPTIAGSSALFGPFAAFSAPLLVGTILNATGVGAGAQIADELEDEVESIGTSFRQGIDRVSEFFGSPTFQNAVREVPARALVARNVAEDRIRRARFRAGQGTQGILAPGDTEGSGQIVQEEFDALLQKLRAFSSASPFRSNLAAATFGSDGEFDPEQFAQVAQAMGLPEELFPGGTAPDWVVRGLTSEGGLPLFDAFDTPRPILGGPSFRNPGASQDRLSPLREFLPPETLAPLERDQGILDFLSQQEGGGLGLLDRARSGFNERFQAGDILTSLVGGSVGAETGPPSEGGEASGAAPSESGETDMSGGLSFGNALGGIDLGDVASFDFSVLGEGLDLGGIDLGGLLEGIDLGGIGESLDDLLGPVDDAVLDTGGDILGELGDRLGGIGGVVGDVFEQAGRGIWDVLTSETAGDILETVLGGGGGGGSGGASGGGSGGGGGGGSSDLLAQILPSLLGAGVGLLGDEGDPAQAGTINPAFPTIARAFGVGTDRRSSGLFVPEGSVPASVFTPDALADMAAFLRSPPGATDAGVQARNLLEGEPVTGRFGDLFDAGQDRFDTLLGSAVPTTSELIETGLPTEIDPIVSEAQRSFRDEFLPDLFERLPTGTLGSSGIPALASREAGRVASELGQLEFEAGENAAQRRLQGLTSALPTVSSATTAASLFPMSFASDLLGVDARARQAEDATDPGGRLFNAFTTLSGLGPSRTITQGAQPSDLEQILQSLSQTVPAGILGSNRGGSSGFTSPFF